MTYNLHPIFVHFPIALLVIYSVIKVLPVRRWLPRVAWKDIERLLLVFGILGAFAALATGDTAEHLLKANRQLVRAHSRFAVISTWLYGALLLGELAEIVSGMPRLAEKVGSIGRSILALLKKYLADLWTSKAIALAALVGITLTGLLGGAIVYGTTADPFAAFILKLLGINL